MRGHQKQGWAPRDGATPPGTRMGVDAPQPEAAFKRVTTDHLPLRPTSPHEWDHRPQGRRASRCPAPTLVTSRGTVSGPELHGRHVELPPDTHIGGAYSPHHPMSDETEAITEVPPGSKTLPEVSPHAAIEVIINKPTACINAQKVVASRRTVKIGRLSSWPWMGPG